MKKISILFASIGVICAIGLSNSYGSKSVCIVSSDPDNNIKYCILLPDGMGDNCVLDAVGPACSGTGTVKEDEKIN
jgi:hypothetical protein